MANDRSCPACGAPMTENGCEYCGFRAERESARGDAEQGRQEQPDRNGKADGRAKNDGLTDKADFLEPEAQVRLGLMFLNGVGVARDAEKATAMFYKAATGGSRDGMFRYAEALRTGEGVETDEKRALFYYVQAARLGHVGARNLLAEMTDGELDVVPDGMVGVADPPKGGFEAVVEKVRPFCVEITCFVNKAPVSQGSGCVLAGGVVLTNAHVILVSDGKNSRVCDEIRVNFDEKYNDRVYPVQPIAVDGDEDIALCVFAGTRPSLPENGPKLLEGGGLNAGREVFTIGNGLGRGLGISKGVISRDVEKNAYGHREVIRTDMSVNPGNSGGALFDMDGDILGMMTFVATQNDRSLAYGMSYAVTADSIIRTMREVMEKAR